MNRFTPILFLGIAWAVHSHAQQSFAPAVQQQPSAAQPPHAGAQVQPRLQPARRLQRADREFMVSAARAGLAQRRAGDLAASRSDDDQVRAFARRLGDDQRRARTQLAQIARAHGVRLPTAPAEQDREWLELLSHLEGDAFDQRFLQQMIQGTRKAIDLFAGVSASAARDRALRGYAAQLVPLLREDLGEAERLHLASRVDAAQASGMAQLPGSAAPTPLAAPVEGRGTPLANARGQVQQAVQVVQAMKSDPAVARLLERAHGVFIVPSYARGALGVGLQAGQGVLVAREGNGLTGPAFYNFGGISVGPQVGIAAGEVAFLLMTERAVQQFRSDRKFSLTLDAGLTIAEYSARGHASTGKVQDVVVWSGTRGAYAGISVGLTDVFADNEENRAYYARPDAMPLTILSGRLEDPYGNPLGRVLGV